MPALPTIWEQVIRPGPVSESGANKRAPIRYSFGYITKRTLATRTITKTGANCLEGGEHDEEKSPIPAEYSVTPV